MDTVKNGPVAQSVKDEGAKTSSEFRDLADARAAPANPAATGQPLTNYHSMFYRLLSWKNPRATAIVYLTTVAFIFAARYLDILRYVLKATFYLLGLTAVGEIAGKAAMGQGLASKMRPKKYFTIPKESLERFLDDAEQFINFFVIEMQRIIFAENVYVTIAAFFSSFLAYFLIKIVPLWGLCVMGTSVLYLSPLIYIRNQAAIDDLIAQGHEVFSAQTKQVREMGSQYAAKASETARTYAGEYTSKAQQMMGKSTGGAGVKSEDFPSAPKEAPEAAGDKEMAEPMAA
ncbi:hypothetical protein K402DRAFT_393963 [Aulographum hederae CBS 113979]|uniref:Reticulon-like protein n=1 Tax=Aulographum hederae CBS 113979 TaxID=1176131 RepID=A0A6G1GYU5_9PEZI|nr:hypothetical protein K402DRAFT_393963 [Aulographum hederae CBS 113979]